MIQKYHTYILGAGASFHAGLPVLSDFFHKAETLCEGNKSGQPPCNGFKNAVDSVRNFRMDNKNNCDPQNIEDVYRLALEVNNVKILEYLERIILGLLDLHGCLVNYDGKQYKPNRIYDSFIEKIYPSGDGVWAARKHIDDTVIITFNWDCLIDYAMFYNLLEPYYAIGQFNGPNTPKLLKMHGSINWGFCRACNSPIQAIAPNDFIGMRYIRKPVEFDLRIVTEGLGRRKCTCGQTLSPKIVPPTHKKNLPSDIVQIWQMAQDVLSKAYKITIIGYSFPVTDTDFVSLFNKAMENNIDLMTVDIINPSNQDKEFQNNYKDVFRKKFTKVQFSQTTTFSNYVNCMSR